MVRLGPYNSCIGGVMAGCEEHQAIVVRVKSLEEGVSKLSTRMDGMESLANLTGKGQAVMEAELKNINNSLSRIEESIKEYFKSVQDRTDKLEKRVEVLENRPANLWDSVIIGIIVAALSSLVTWVITRGKG